MNLIFLALLLPEAWIAYAAYEPEAASTHSRQVCKNIFRDVFGIDRDKYHCSSRGLSGDTETDKASEIKLETESGTRFGQTDDASDEAEENEDESDFEIWFAEGRELSRAELLFRRILKQTQQIFYLMGLNKGTFHQSHLDKFGRACMTDSYRAFDRWYICMDVRARTCRDLHVTDAVIDECVRQTLTRIKDLNLEGEFGMMEPCWHCPLGNVSSNAPTLFLRLSRRHTDHPPSIGRDRACSTQCGYYHLAAELDGRTLSEVRTEYRQQSK